MSVSVQVSTTIDRPIAKVFRFYAINHVANHPRWDPDMHLEQVSAGPIGVGTIIARRNTHFGTPIEGTMEVIEFEPNCAMGVVIHDGPNESRGRVTFEADGPERTRLAINAEIGDVDESMADVVTSMVERTAANIKRLVESEP